VRPEVMELFSSRRRKITPKVTPLPPSSSPASGGPRGVTVTRVTDETQPVGAGHDVRRVDRLGVVAGIVGSVAFSVTWRPAGLEEELATWSVRAH
jgi:hypothetical protein